MNVAQITTFVTLARTLNYTETARALFISQPAVSQQIARLEAELGVKLLDRSSRGVEITAAGRTYYEDCVDILARLENARSRAQNQANELTDRVRVGCGSLVFVPRLAETLRLFHQRRPHTWPLVSYNSLDTLLGSLASRELDIAVMARSANTAAAGFAFEQLLEGRFVCVVPVDSPWCERDSVGIEELDGSPLVYLEDSRAPTEMRSVQARLALATPHSPAFYCDSSMVGATMAKAGLGLAVMADFACPQIDGIATLPLRGVDPVPYGLFWDDRRADEAVHDFVLCAREAFGED